MYASSYSAIAPILKPIKGPEKSRSLNATLNTRRENKHADPGFQNEGAAGLEGGSLKMTALHRLLFVSMCHFKGRGWVSQWMRAKTYMVES